MKFLPVLPPFCFRCLRKAGSAAEVFKVTGLSLEHEPQHARTVAAYLQARNRACQQNHIAPAAGAAFGVSASGVSLSELRQKSANNSELTRHAPCEEGFD